MDAEVFKTPALKNAIVHFVIIKDGHKGPQLTLVPNDRGVQNLVAVQEVRFR